MKRHRGWWDDFFLGMAEYIATASKDPSTKCGCVIVRPDRTIASVGYNGFPRGVDDRRARYDDRPTKYAMVEHAEANAILNAREPLHGCVAYTTFAPCSSCAAMLIQAGILMVVTRRPTDEQIERWGESFKHAQTMLEEAGVPVAVR